MLNVFNFNQAQPVRLEMDEKGVPWFAAPDVCGILGYKNSPQAISQHCRTKGISKRYTLSQGGKQQTTFITEGNLYRLIIKSRLPAAEQFEQWLMDEVLPSIRKTGSYQMDAPRGQMTFAGAGFHADPRKVWGRELIADAVIEFEGSPIRVIRADASLRFVAKDCCIALGYVRQGVALQSLDTRFKRLDLLTDTMGRAKKMNTLALEGVLEMAKSCRLPRAEGFYTFMQQDAVSQAWTQAAIQ